MLYGTAGVAVGGVKASVSPAAPGTNGSFSETAVGWTVGAGIEAMLAQNVSTRTEYAYIDLGTRQAPVETLGTTNAFGTSSHAHTVKLSVNLHF